MKIINLRSHKKKYAQRTLIEFDKKLQEQYSKIEDHMFDRQTRNSTLKSGEFSPPSGTLFEAIFKELKMKEENERTSHSLSRALFRLRNNRAKKQLIESG